MAMSEQNFKNIHLNSFCVWFILPVGRLAPFGRGREWRVLTRVAVAEGLRRPGVFPLASAGEGGPTDRVRGKVGASFGLNPHPPAPLPRGRKTPGADHVVDPAVFSGSDSPHAARAAVVTPDRSGRLEKPAKMLRYGH